MAQVGKVEGPQEVPQPSDGAGAGQAAAETPELTIDVTEVSKLNDAAAGVAVDMQSVVSPVFAENVNRDGGAGNPVNPADGDEVARLAVESVDDELHVEEARELEPSDYIERSKDFIQEMRDFITEQNDLAVPTKIVIRDSSGAGASLVALIESGKDLEKRIKELFPRIHGIYEIEDDEKNDQEKAAKKALEDVEQILFDAQKLINKKINALNDKIDELEQNFHGLDFANSDYAILKGSIQSIEQSLKELNESSSDFTVDDLELSFLNPQVRIRTLSNDVSTKKFETIKKELNRIDTDLHPLITADLKTENLDQLKTKVEAVKASASDLLSDFDENVRALDSDAVVESSIQDTITHSEELITKIDKEKVEKSYKECLAGVTIAADVSSAKQLSEVAAKLKVIADANGGIDELTITPKFKTVARGNAIEYNPHLSSNEPGSYICIYEIRGEDGNGNKISLDFEGRDIATLTASDDIAKVRAWRFATMSAELIVAHTLIQAGKPYAGPLQGLPTTANDPKWPHLLDEKSWYVNLDFDQSGKIKGVKNFIPFSSNKPGSLLQGVKLTWEKDTDKSKFISDLSGVPQPRREINVQSDFRPNEIYFDTEEEQIRHMSATASFGPDLLDKYGIKTNADALKYLQGKDKEAVELQKKMRDLDDKFILKREADFKWYHLRKPADIKRPDAEQPLTIAKKEAEFQANIDPDKRTEKREAYQDLINKQKIYDEKRISKEWITWQKENLSRLPPDNKVEVLNDAFKQKIKSTLGKDLTLGEVAELNSWDFNKPDLPLLLAQQETDYEGFVQTTKNDLDAAQARYDTLKKEFFEGTSPEFQAFYSLQRKEELHSKYATEYWFLTYMKDQFDGKLGFDTFKSENKPDLIDFIERNLKRKLSSQEIANISSIQSNLMKSQNLDNATVKQNIEDRIVVIKPKFDKLNAELTANKKKNEAIRERYIKQQMAFTDHLAEMNGIQAQLKKLSAEMDLVKTEMTNKKDKDGNPIFVKSGLLKHKESPIEVAEWRKNEIDRFIRENDKGRIAKYQKALEAIAPQAAQAGSLVGAVSP